MRLPAFGLPSLVGSVLAILLLVSGSASAQSGPEVRLELRSERVVFADLARIDDEEIVVRQGARELVFARDEVVSLRMVQRGSSGADPNGVLDPALLGDDELPVDDTEAAVPTEVQGPDEIATKPAPGRVRPVAPASKRATDGTDDRIASLLDRYVWLVPTDDGHRFGVGALLLLALSGLVGASARIAAAPKNGFGRSVAAATTLATFLGVSASLLSRDAPGLAILVGGAIAVFLLSQMVVFRTKLLGSLIAFLSFLLVSLVSVALIEILGILIHQRELME